MSDKLTEGNLARHDKEAEKRPEVIPDPRPKTMTQLATVGGWSKHVNQEHVKGGARSTRRH